MTDQHSRYDVWTVPKWCQQQHISFRCVPWQRSAISTYTLCSAVAVTGRRPSFYQLKHLQAINNVSPYWTQDEVTDFEDVLSLAMPFVIKMQCVHCPTSSVWSQLLIYSCKLFCPFSHKTQKLKSGPQQSWFLYLQ